VCPRLLPLVACKTISTCRISLPHRLSPPWLLTTISSLFSSHETIPFLLPNWRAPLGLLAYYPLSHRRLTCSPWSPRRLAILPLVSSQIIPFLLVDSHAPLGLLADYPLSPRRLMCSPWSCAHANRKWLPSTLFNIHVPSTWFNIHMTLRNI
jgi:hypothetical protein